MSHAADCSASSSSARDGLPPGERRWAALAVLLGATFAAA